jgi:hypothetical protein
MAHEFLPSGVLSLKQVMVHRNHSYAEIVWKTRVTLLYLLEKFGQSESYSAYMEKSQCTAVINLDLA